MISPLAARSLMQILQKVWPQLGRMRGRLNPASKSVIQIAQVRADCACGTMPELMGAATAMTEGWVGKGSSRSSFLSAECCDLG